MKRVHKGKVEHVVSLLLIITFGILLGVTTVTAQEQQEDLIDFVTLFQGQSGSASTTQSTPFASHSVFVTSIGNRTLGATLSGMPNDTLGWWTMTLVGTGGKNFSDFKFGLLPWGVPKAAIDIGSPVSFGLAISSVFITNKTAAELASKPVGYSIAVGQ